MTATNRVYVEIPYISPKGPCDRLPRVYLSSGDRDRTREDAIASDLHEFHEFDTIQEAEVWFGSHRGPWYRLVRALIAAIKA